MSNSVQGLPKPVFPYIGRMYEAVVSQGFIPTSLNRENAERVIKILSRTTWSIENKDLIMLWTLGGDAWGELIKDVKLYSIVVNKSKRLEISRIKKEEKNKG